MRIGIASPVVIAPPGAPRWEQHAGIAELERVAATADELGFHHLTCSEHVAVPTDIASERGGTYWDPLSTLSYLAARTRTIRLATLVLVLGYHHPLELAKRYGTLDRLSAGRVVLGLGVGSLRAEFEILGAPFEDRGTRADDAIAALRAALSSTDPRYHGRFHDFADVVVRPHAVQPRVPLWIGGRTRRSLRRAIALGDGWVPFGLDLPALGQLLGTHDLPDGFTVVLPATVDPVADRDRARRALVARRDVGCSIVNVSILARDCAHYCDQLAALREIGDDLGVEFDPAPHSVSPTGGKTP